MLGINNKKQTKRDEVITRNRILEKFALCWCSFGPLLAPSVVGALELSFFFGLPDKTHRYREQDLTAELRAARTSDFIITHMVTGRIGLHSVLLPLQIMHRGHTWHDYPWPGVSLTWLLYNLQLEDVTSADFENSVYAFGQSAEIVSLMYDKFIIRLEDSNGTAVSSLVGLNPVCMEFANHQATCNNAWWPGSFSARVRNSSQRKENITVFGKLHKLKRVGRLNYGIQGHLFTSHWITKVPIVLCFVLEKILTHVKQVVRSGPAFCSCSQNYLTWRFVCFDTHSQKLPFSGALKNGRPVLLTAYIARVLWGTL